MVSVTDALHGWDTLIRIVTADAGRMSLLAVMKMTSFYHIYIACNSR